MSSLYVDIIVELLQVEVKAFRRQVLSLAIEKPLGIAVPMDRNLLAELTLMRMIEVSKNKHRSIIKVNAS